MYCVIQIFVYLNFVHSSKFKQYRNRLVCSRIDFTIFLVIRHRKKVLIFPAYLCSLLNKLKLKNIQKLLWPCQDLKEQLFWEVDNAADTLLFKQIIFVLIFCWDNLHCYGKHFFLFDASVSFVFSLIASWVKQKQKQKRSISSLLYFEFETSTTIFQTCTHSTHMFRQKNLK